MPSDPTLKLTIRLIDPDLDEEEKDEAAQRLLAQLKELDEVEFADRVSDPNPPALNKGWGGYLPGRVVTEVKPGNVKSLFRFLSDHFSYKPIEVELEINGRVLKVKARSPEQLAAVLQSMQRFIDSPTDTVNTRKILILAANPQDTGRLRLDQEVRDIAEGLARSQHRHQFELQQRWAVRTREIQRAMLEVSPQILHFSGHGSGEPGLVFEDEMGSSKRVDGNALAGLFNLFADRLECVVLNGCYSEVQATAIAQHINYVIGMSHTVSDKAAIEFAVGFYDALGAGRDIDFAYAIGCSAIQLAGTVDNPTPVLKKKSGV